MIDRN